MLNKDKDTNILKLPNGDVRFVNGALLNYLDIDFSDFSLIELQQVLKIFLSEKMPKNNQLRMNPIHHDVALQGNTISIVKNGKTTTYLTISDYKIA